MYNINLNELEMIIYNNDDAYVLSNNKKIEVSLVITNQRLMLLEDGNKLGNLNTILKTTKGMSFIPNREIIFEVSLEQIIATIPGEYVKLILSNSTFVEIQDVNIIHILENIN